MLNLDDLEVTGEEILYLASIPIHIINRQMKIWRNEASKRLFPNKNGTYCYEIIAERDKVCDDCAVLEVLKQGVAQTRERRFKKMFFTVTIVPIFSKKTSMITGVIEVLENKTAIMAYQKKLEEMIITDELTKIYNRIGILNVLREEFARAERYKSVFSIALFDVDDFKLVNDGYGHEVGDTVLAKLSACVKSVIRDTDKVGRYGGDEFLIILPETNLEEALNLVSRVEKEISNHKFLLGMKVNISVGVTQYFPEDDSIETLIRRADDEMYKNKKIKKE